MTKIKPAETFDKYYYYSESVQSPEVDAEFFEQRYIDVKGKKPKTLREDFCAAFLASCEWVKRSKDYVAHVVDLDPEPLEYGRENYLPELTDDQRSRIHIYQKNVLDPDLEKCDIVAACNFSYQIFKKRNDLLAYFKNVYKTIKDDGILILDNFGGKDCMEPNVSETEYEDAGYSYYWDQDSFNPVTNEALFYIHFKRDGEKKRERVFTYDWRMWSIPELRDLLADAGFSKTHVYWEGTDEDGDGDGVFTKTEVGEDDCESWVAYIVAEK